ncbi:hypothetical protein, variant [Aphanomyces invadans]|uniref:Uncharacterized protein n=1 Tax=Aphanomyces invadans TaxID=157072 RepID=A0A024UMY8_9STRA|nr:hypothetical protein, variant [Aphanomyces invadans]ETW07674.1 hypothetical protein, variant [Aphanomyces invadans]|eukprot:XP_008863767.1 hypothetical protein, variant [Aphanomyces invadans]
MLSRAASFVRVGSSAATRNFHSSPILSARKSKSLSRLTIKRTVRETQNAMKNLDITQFQDDEEESPSVQITNMKAALKQLRDPNSFELDKIPLLKRGSKANDDFMTEEEFEAFLDEDEDEEDEEHDRELEELEHEGDKKRATKMLSPSRAMKALQDDDKKRTKNEKPLQREENSRFNPEVVNHRQQRVGLMLEGFIQDVILRETDLCQGSTQVWVTSVCEVTRAGVAFT